VALFFKTHHKDIQHCSYECRRIHNEEMLKTTCAGCGKIFNRVSGNTSQKYCSLDCYYKDKASVTRSIESRLDKYSIKKDNGCVEWTGAVAKTGYGVLNVDGKVTKAHRLSYIANKGEIIDGNIILHECDNRKCINPDHLKQGTYKDNSLDVVNKKRHRHGENAIGVILNEEKVKNIRIEYIPKVTSMQNLADKHNVSNGAIFKIIHGVTWKHI